MHRAQRFTILIVGILTLASALMIFGQVRAVAPDLILADDFESGNFSAWTSASTGGGDLSVSPTAALVGSRGMQVLINDPGNIYVTDDTPNAELHYRARFYFDPNGIAMTDGNSHYLFLGYDSVGLAFQIEFRYLSGAYQVRLRQYNDAAVVSSASYVTISDATHMLETEWWAANAPGANNGGAKMWIDGALYASLSGSDNDTRRIDGVKLGAASSVDAGTLGTYFIDAFESRRETYIGPVGTPAPTLSPTPSYTPVPGGTIRFAVIGDYGNNSPAEGAVANLVKSWNPDFIITTGDNNYPDGGADTIDVNVGQYYHEFIYPYIGSYGAGAAFNRFFPSMGNHEWHAINAQPYLDYFTLPGNERYYDFVWGPAHFFAIDSDSLEPDGQSSSSAQAFWLQTQLASSMSPWNLVYFHHSPYSSGLSHGSSTTLQWPFQAWGADAVLSGHDHDYERIVINGFPYFVNGLGGNGTQAFTTPVPGSELRYNGDNGAMLVEAASSYIIFQFITRAGLLIDSYTLGSPATATPSLTATASLTSTYSPTPTDTSTPSMTWTPTDTATPTETGTHTFTPTASATPSITFTPTDIAIPTETGTPTQTPLATDTPTDTAIPTPTHTATATATRTLTPTSSSTSSTTPIADLIFANGFESGNLSAWTSSATDAGDLSVSASAALTGTNGLRALIDDNNAIYVTDDSPNAETRYRVRFYFDPNSIPMGSNDSHYIFYGYSGSSTDVLRVQFRYSSGAYQLRAAFRNDSSSWTSSSYFAITDAPHFIELDWRASTASGANNGSLTFWIDGTQRANLTGMDNDTRRIDRARLGAISSIDNSTRGAYYFDAFESRRLTYIGP